MTGETVDLASTRVFEPLTDQTLLTIAGVSMLIGVSIFACTYLNSRTSYSNHDELIRDATAAI